jgi:biotin carboxyl carrier protein
VAVSAQEQFDRQADLLQSIEELMRESLLRDALPGRAAAAQGNMLETTVHEQLRSRTGAGFIGSYPLRDAAALPTGVLVVLAKEDPRADARSREQFEEITRLVAALLDLCVRSQPSWVQRLTTRVAGRHGVARKPAAWIALGLCLLLLAAPLPYRVRCDCQVQPAQRRYVSVPYDGRLEAVLVEPGDLVEQGQTLARMDGRDIVWELGTLHADLKQAEKRYDTALADFDTAASQLARLEAERLRLEIELLEKRLERLEIKSPLPGAVIGGEPKELVGARLTKGQTILEIGPLDQMTVELAVHDEDIAHVELGQPVRFRLAGQPHRHYDGTIARIHPRSEDRDGDNVFVAEVKFDNTMASIRPGMEGTAKVTTARHMLAWNLFHKLWHALLFRLGW